MIDQDRANTEDMVNTMLNMNRGSIVRKFLIAVMVLICLGFGAGAVWLYLSEDRQGPEITIPDSKISYQEGSEYDALLDGVTAFDEVNGDVTDSLRIEGIFPSIDDKTAEVIYVAKDNRNNMTKKSRIVTYVPEADTVNSQVSLDEENDDEIVDSPADSEIVAEETEMPSAAVSPAAALTETPKPGAPQITLTDSAVTVERGAAVNRLIYVKDITDDKDSRESLFGNIQIDGTINSAVVGTYELTYYVVDSDGNKSNEAKLVVSVE